MSNNYWVVGAAWGGTEDALPPFLERGYWYCWDPKYDTQDSVSANVKAQRELFKQIKENGPYSS